MAEIYLESLYVAIIDEKPLRSMLNFLELVTAEIITRAQFSYSLKKPNLLPIFPNTITSPIKSLELVKIGEMS